ncbi:hypothetical protein FALBO_1852 [Fusarium albosuccineum]|uniref:Uncharacterized protein n=1 Tax=Fusarium albosuccineum TaxID=1237068 RepID=A0A8H4PD65_9HYPO|nr:hypothetical protein FALBO_1852 [Fusarium albosuccineum]
MRGRAQSRAGGREWWPPVQGRTEVELGRRITLKDGILGAIVEGQEASSKNERRRSRDRERKVDVESGRSWRRERRDAAYGAEAGDKGGEEDGGRNVDMMDGDARVEWWCRQYSNRSAP